MLIVEFDGPPSWSLDASETGESTKFPWVVTVRLKGGSEGAENVVPSTTPTHGHFVLSPVSLVSRGQDGSPSNSTIDIYDLTEK